MVVPAAAPSAAAYAAAQQQQAQQSGNKEPDRSRGSMTRRAVPHLDEGEANERYGKRRQGAPRGGSRDRGGAMDLTI